MLEKQKITNKLIWNIAYPIIFGNMAQALVSFVDTAFLGHLGAIELGASMMAGIYYYVFSTLAWGFAMGLQIIVARRFGEKKYKDIGFIFGHGLVVVGVLAIFIFLLLHCFTGWFLGAVIKSENIYIAAMQYMNFRHYGIVFVCFNFIFRALYIGISNTKVITYTTLIMAFVNLALDYALIFGKLGFAKMGIGGAALASVIAELSALIFFIFYTLKILPFKKYRLFSFKKLKLSLFQSLLKLSLPTMFQRLLSFGTWFIFFVMIEKMGEMPIAISSIVRSVYMLILIPVFAFGATANTLTSRLIGEGRKTEISIMLGKTLKMSILAIMPLVLTSLVFPQAIASIYTDNAELISATSSSLFVICIAAITMSFGIIVFEAVSGTGNTLSALILETFVLIIYISFIWIMVEFVHPNVAWVWACEIVYASSIGILSVLYLKYANWQKKKI